MLGVLLTIAALYGGCAMPHKGLHINNRDQTLEPGTIIATATAEPVSFQELVEALRPVRIVYVGEQHTNQAHHNIQLQVIKALASQDQELSVGIEMVDRTYQPVLDDWAAGRLTQTQFLQHSHWYANWRFDFELYKAIFDYIRDQHVALYGLNIPFCIPPKISTGGIESLRNEERRQLPGTIDMSNTEHRAYVKEIYQMHHLQGRENFEYFYEAQCVWEDIMAQTIAERLGSGRMVVLAGNGHIVKGFGIPQRAYRRTQVPYRTIYLAPAGTRIEGDEADYVWVTPPTRWSGHAHARHPSG
jgi:uncharacterized iron-regulated protein